MRFNVFFLLTQWFVPLQPRFSLTDTAVFGQVTSYKLQVTNETESFEKKICKALLYYYNIYIIIYNNIIYLINFKLSRVRSACNTICNF